MKFLLRILWHSFLEALHDYKQNSLMDTNFWSNILYILFYTQEITLSVYNSVQRHDSLP